MKAQWAAYRLAALLIGWSAVVSPAAATAATSAAGATGWFTQYDASSFRQLPAAARPIDWNRLNKTLLDAAVFHETNRRRQQAGLPALAFDTKARRMAQIQSLAMARHDFVGHENPEPGRRTLADRVRVVGLRPAFAGENVASAFARRYRSGTRFYIREENGVRVPSFEPNGPPIPMHTYLSFAVALVDGWMRSPGHRQNILHREPRFLGTACEPAQSGHRNLETLFCTQVFHRPLE